jgi:hypothetical protein
MILLAEDDSKLAPDLPLEGTIDANPAPLTLMQRLRHTISEAQVGLPCDPELKFSSCPAMQG